ncbi:hypothetical protein FJ366_01210 [Candidatus Dependentiae bacterium]|nr:hypothetical protein [Candidatus Dependentiae bacterium]
MKIILIAFLVLYVTQEAKCPPIDQPTENVTHNESAKEINKSSLITETFCKKMSTASLYEKVMQFPLQDMIDRCKLDHNYTDQDMQILEKELRRFLYLCLQNKNGGTGMYSKDVDNLWHAFILHTPEYVDFSNLTKGSYIHHIPKRPNEPQKKDSTDFALFIRNYEATFNEKIHPVWFIDMIEKQQ